MCGTDGHLPRHIEANVRHEMRGGQEGSERCTNTVGKCFHAGAEVAEEDMCAVKSSQVINPLNAFCIVQRADSTSQKKCVLQDYGVFSVAPPTLVGWADCM